MEFWDLEFSLWKFKFQDVRSVETSDRSIEAVRKASQSIEALTWSIELIKKIDLKLLLDLIDAHFEGLWDITTLHMYLLKGYNPMDFKWTLTSIYTHRVITFKRYIWRVTMFHLKSYGYKETQKILWLFSKISICRT